MESEEKLSSLPDGDLTDSLTHCDDYDAQAFCNCENNECITPYQSDEQVSDSEAWEAHTAPQNKKTADQSTANRLCVAWKAANGNPYLKKTHVCQIELYRTPTDPSPIDSFRVESVKGFTARALAILGGTVLLGALTVAWAIRNG